MDSLINMARGTFHIFILIFIFCAAKFFTLQVENNYLKEQAETANRKLHMYECITSKEFDGHSILEASKICEEIVL